MNRKQVIWYLILTVLFTIPAVFSIFYHSFFTFHDETQIVNLYEFFKTIDLGQFPPRWGLDFHFNYGSPFPQFYYQTPYYLGYLFHRLGFSAVETFQQLLVFGFFAGSIGMYLLALQLTSPLWSFVCAVIFTFTPYRAVASYVRGSLGESLAMAFFPWVLLFSLRLYREPSFRKSIVTGLSWAILVLTHQLATIFFLPFVFLAGLLSAFRKTKLLPYLFLSGIVSLGASAYYLFPTLLEQKFIQPSSPFNFYDHFPFIKQLIYSQWGYRASIWGILDGLSFQIGIVQWLLLAVSLLLTIPLLKSKMLSQNKTLFLYFVGSFFVTLFLMNIRSSFFWNVFPFTQLVQFPWRLLMITTFLIPLIFAFITTIIPSKFTPYLAIIVLAVSALSNLSYFQTGEIYDRNDDYYLHRFLPNQATQDKDSISQAYLEHTEDYVSLPTAASRPNSLPPAKLTATEPQTTIELNNNDPFDQEYTINSLKDEQLTFNTFDFPGWHVELDKQPIVHQKNNIGAIIFNFPKGEHLVTISYSDTPIRHTANIISFLSIAFVTFFLLKKP